MPLHPAKPGEAVDLRPLGAELLNTGTTALVKTKSFEAVRMTVKAGGEKPPHQVAGVLFDRGHRAQDSRQPGNAA